jgi:hypothetical protein
VKETTDFRSDYGMMEISRHTLFSDHFRLLFFELPKISKVLDRNDPLGLWLAMFQAKKRVDLERIDALEVPIMQEAIKAYRSTIASDYFKEVERLRHEAKSNEASALRHAAEVERAKWEPVVARKDEVIALKDEVIALKDDEIALKDEEIARLKAESAQRPK